MSGQSDRYDSNGIADIFQIALKDLESQQQTPGKAYSRARDRYRETPQALARMDLRKLYQPGSFYVL